MNNSPKVAIGIDIGSTTLKVVVLDEQGSAIYTDYMRHKADILATAHAIFSRMYVALGNVRVAMTFTGSVGMGYAEKLSAPFIQEVIAAANFVKQHYPDAKTLIDIGGEDSKMIFFEEHRVPDIRMNGNCAGGTGAFIDQTASLLGIEIEQLNGLAEQAQTIHPIASRCGVFSKTDIQNLMGMGVTKSDVAASVLNAMALQVVGSLARGAEIAPKIILCGGPFAFIPELKKVFLKVLHCSEEDLVTLQQAHLIPASGAALHSAQLQRSGKQTPIPIALALRWIERKQHAPADTENTSSLPQLFTSEEEMVAWRKERQIATQMVAQVAESGADEECYIGIDSGSTTTKVVVINSDKKIIFKDYQNNSGDNLQTAMQSFKKLKETMERQHKSWKIVSSCATGYGENLIKAAFNMEFGIVETSAHFMASQSIVPNVSFILDIGGQDMKAMFIANGVVQRIEINEACSSGCGSFIQTYAQGLGYSVEAFAQMAALAPNPYDLGTRCTVFMNSKVKQAMREGISIENIAGGFSYSVIKNSIYKVLKLKSIEELGDAIVVQGGTFKNVSVARALEQLTGKKVYFTEVPELMGAYGAALYAMSQKK